MRDCDSSVSFLATFIHESEIQILHWLLPIIFLDDQNIFRAFGSYWNPIRLERTAVPLRNARDG